MAVGEQSRREACMNAVEEGYMYIVLIVKRDENIRWIQRITKRECENKEEQSMPFGHKADNILFL